MIDHHMPFSSAPRRFVIITVVEEADAAVRRIFPLSNQITLKGRLYWSARLPTYGGGEVEVFASQCRDRSNIPAAVLATEMVIELAPDYLLLVDIAGGVFREKDSVNLGDVLVSTYLQYYEFRKHIGGGVRERVFAIEEASPELLTVVNQIQRTPSLKWWMRTNAERPTVDGGGVAPVLRTGEILCGDKLLGDPSDRLLKTHLKRYDKADAVDMESVGVARALWETSTRGRVEFLVIRGISDFCNKEGNQATRDTWKKYAAEAAAALAYEVVAKAGTLSKPDELLRSYRGELERRVASLAAPPKLLPVCIRVNGIPDVPVANSDAFLRVVVQRRRVLLHGPAGAGKTVAAERIASACLTSGGIPVLISASGSASGHAALTGDPAEDLDRILAGCSVPTRLSLLDGMSQGVSRLVIFDGLNEVYDSSAVHIVRALDWLAGSRADCSVVVTDRASRSILSADWTTAEILPLDPGAVDPYVEELERHTGTKVAAQERELLRSPFFLDRIINAPRADLQSPAQAIREFLRIHGGLEDSALPQASMAAFLAYVQYRSRTFQMQQLAETLGDALLEELVNAGLIVRDRGDEAHFFHQLQHDYLASRHLATHEELWTSESFDAVTFGTPSGDGLTALTLIPEQLPDEETGDRFIRRVYDWSWLGAIRCTGEAAAASPRRCTSETEAAIVALVSEKLFDPVPNTRRKAQASVQRFRSALARRLTSSSSLGELIQRLGEIQSVRNWFNEWRVLFSVTAPSGAQVAAVESEDPVTGWTASNILRRSPVAENVRALLCECFDRHRATSSHDRAVRWRIVHSLGRSSGRSTVQFLFQVLLIDEHPWVRYGAVLALVEVTVHSPDEGLRREVLAWLTESAAKLPPGVRHEAGEALAHDNPPPGWSGLVLPFLKAARDEATDGLERKRWEERIRTFESL
jgi:nucleoside phosphorylase